MFPEISHISQLREKVEHLSEVRFMEHDNGFTTVCVMIADNETYSGENAMWVRECRGITFDKEGKIASRGLHKFFNVNEREETQEKNLDWKSVSNVMMKRDGSVINPVLVDGVILFKSKKTFTSDVAVLANKYATLSDKIFSRFLLEQGLSPTFEFTSPEARIVIKYRHSKLVLLHIRENVSGRYLTPTQIQNLISDFESEYVDRYNLSWETIKAQLPVIQDIEGYVIQFSSGEMVKAKTKWYLHRHHAYTALTHRNVVEAVVSEALDDMKSFIYELNEPELFAKVLDIEHQVKKQINDICLQVEALVSEDKHLSRKDFAIKHSSNKLFGLMMTLFLEKQPDYLAFYEKHYLKTWPITTL